MAAGRYRGGASDDDMFGDEPDEHLPWLGAEEDEPGPRIDGGRILTLLATLAMGAAALAGGLWWAFSRSGETGIVADGSLIEAPDTPYKVRPADPGGARVSGTGDFSYAVGEGREFEGRIEARRPPPPAGAQGEAGPAEVGPAPLPAQWGVQVGAYPSEAQARAAWQQFVTRTPSLQGRGYRIVEGMADGSPTFLLQALAGDPADADLLCRAVRAEGGDCQVKR